MVEENDIAKLVVDAAWQVHQELGQGLLESAYQAALAYELKHRGLEVIEEASVPLNYRGVKLETAFRADLIVGNRVLVELKSVEKLEPVHKKQVITYLKLTKLKVGLLINFGEPYFKKAVTRLVNELK